MNPVSNVDRILVILRQRLNDQAKAGRRTTSATAPSRGASTAQSIAALVGAGNIDERQLRRTLIQSLLADQLGPQMINDARFQHVLGQVSDAIEQDHGARKLVDQIIAGLQRSQA